MVNGIPYGKSGYARSATLYDIEVTIVLCKCKMSGYLLKTTTKFLLQITESQLLFLNIMTNGGSGDVDIYVKRDDFPT